MVLRMGLSFYQDLFEIKLSSLSYAKISYVPTLSPPTIHEAKELERGDFSKQTEIIEQVYIKTQILKHILSQLYRQISKTDKVEIIFSPKGCYLHFNKLVEFCKTSEDEVPY